MANIDRVLTVKTNNREVFSGMRVRLRGRANMTLLPDFFIVEAYNALDSDVERVRNSRELTVYDSYGSIMCTGRVEDIFTRQEGGNIVTGFGIADGQAFWETKASRNIGSGAGVKAAIFALAMNISMGSYLADDVRMIRGITVNGRVADTINELASSVNARAFVSHDVLHVVAKGRSEIISNLSEDDAIEEPQISEGVAIVRTDVRSWPVGMLCKFRGLNCRIVAQDFDADSFTGTWDTNVFLVDEDYVEDIY